MAHPWTLYRTTEMERAVESMALRNRHSVLKKMYKTKNPIYIRTNNCQGVAFYIFNPKQKSTERELQRWKDNGGVLIEQSTDYKADERIETFDAFLMTETPRDIGCIEMFAERCRREAIVFRPPTWAQHEATVARLFPTGLAMERAFDNVADHLRSGLSPKFKQVLRDCNIEPGEHSFVATDKEIADELGVEVITFQALRARILEVTRKKYWQPLMCLIPKIEPEERSYLEIYRFIESLPDRMNGERYCQDGKLRSLSREYKSIVRAMVRAGSLEKRPYVHVWDLNLNRDLIPEIFDREHRRAVAELQHVKQTVDSALSYPL